MREMMREMLLHVIQHRGICNLPDSVECEKCILDDICWGNTDDYVKCSTEEAIERRYKKMLSLYIERYGKNAELLGVLI